MGHIYVHLSPDDDILLSEDATTTHPTHSLEASDESLPIQVGAHSGPEARDESPPLNDIHKLVLLVDADTNVGNSDGSGSDDSESLEDDDDGSSTDECSDDDLDVELDDMYGGDPLDLDYED